MENTVRLSDQELIEIAWEAVRAHIEPSDYQGSNIEIDHKLPNYSPTEPDVLEPEQIWVWLNHPAGSSLKDTRATVRANSALSTLAEARGDKRDFLLFHGFSETRFKRAAAA